MAWDDRQDAAQSHRIRANLNHYARPARDNRAMEGATTDHTGTVTLPRIPPRRAALLIAAIAGVSAGAMGFWFQVIPEYWPEGWGGHAAGMLVITALIPGCLALQVALLKPLFRWTGLRLLDLLDRLHSGSSRDAGFFILAFLIACVGVGGTMVLLSLLLSDWLGENHKTFFPLAGAWVMGFVVSAGFVASAQVLPEQIPLGEDGKEAERPGWEGLLIPYLAGLANLCLAGPLFIWITMGPLAAPAEPAAGALLGATMGAAVGIGGGARPGQIPWRLLVAGLLAADLAAGAVAFPAAWAMAAYGYGPEDLLPIGGALAGMIGMFAATAFPAERFIRRRREGAAQAG